MKVSELNPPELDYWVAKAEGLDPEILPGSQAGDNYPWRPFCNLKGSGRYRPTFDWSQGGPIMEREDIETGLGHPDDNIVGIGIVDPNKPLLRWANCHGKIRWAGRKETLIAIMRAYIASEFGEEVTETQREHA